MAQILSPLKVGPVLLLGLLSVAGCTTSPAPSATVKTDSGWVEGRFEGTLKVYRGIPFAAAPTGDRRWKPPVPPGPWDETRDASEFGAYCPQVLRPGYSAEVLAPYAMDEDCLNLNIWAPDDAGVNKRYPVMVWILPGSFRVGAAQMNRYWGEHLAESGVVLVTFNYRLGLFGQFAHPSLSAEANGTEHLANYGLMDQLAALEWVQRNIGAFGGDESNVTIFGMSAGGVSVNYLMAAPAAKGLFHRAISQSSGVRIGAPRLLDRDRPGVPSLETEGQMIAARLGIAGLTSSETVAALRALPVKAILDYQANNRLGNGGSLNPVVDGRLVVESVGDAFDSGREHPVPYMTGATSWEGSLVAFLPTADLLLAGFGVSRESAAELYGEVSEAELVNGLETDFFFGSQHYLAKRHSQNGHPSFVYFFSRVIEAHRDELPGAAHGAETRYVFRTLDSLAGPASMPEQGTVVSLSDHAYAELVSRYWVDFARTGNPNHPGQIEWPQFDPANPSVLEFAQRVPKSQNGFRAKRMAFFEEAFRSKRL